MRLATRSIIRPLLAGVLLFAFAGSAYAITSVTLPGSFQSELGCAGDWDPACASTHLTDQGNGTWKAAFNVPAGTWEYKVAIDDSWTENYGQGGVQDGANYSLTLANPQLVTFTYDATSHVVTNDALFVQPNSVTLAGSLQSEAGCAGDWDPACATTHLTLGGNGHWTGTFNLPAGNYEYKIAIDDSWTENYGAGGVANGSNITLSLAQDAPVTFDYDPQSHLVTTSAGQVVTAPGSYQSEAGCPGDWMPDCTTTQLLPDGAIYTYTSPVLPAGDYEFKIAISKSWDENYGQGGVPGGANVPFTIPKAGATVTITYDPQTHVPTATVNGSVGVHRASWGTIKSLYR